MKKILSTALFGTADRTHYGGEPYRAFLSAFVLAAANLHPRDEGWEIRIHVDPANALSPFLEQLDDAKLIRVVPMPGPVIHCRSMLWRLAPVFEDGVDYVWSRDLDALPMPRDRACMDSFIRSRCIVHAVHDNVQHGSIPGGLCGFHAPAFCQATAIESLDELYRFAEKTDVEWARHGSDQEVLARLCLRSGGPQLLEHRYGGWANGKPAQNPRRPPGKYACGGLSSPVPDEGRCRLTDELTAEADRLAGFIGAAGFDHAAALAWWMKNGDQTIAQTCGMALL